jgi:hypothetical protein
MLSTMREGKGYARVAGAYDRWLPASGYLAGWSADSQRPIEPIIDRTLLETCAAPVGAWIKTTEVEPRAMVVVCREDGVSLMLEMRMHPVFQQAVTKKRRVFRTMLG